MWCQLPISTSVTIRTSSSSVTSVVGGGGTEGRWSLTEDTAMGGGAATVSKSYTLNLCCVKEKERATDLELQAVLVG